MSNQEALVSQSSPVTVAPSLPRFLGLAVLLPLFVAITVWSLVGLGAVMYAAAATVGVLCAICVIMMAITSRPRVVITTEGFTFYKLLGSVPHRWEEIDGPFAVIKIGWSKAVAYKLTTEYMARVGKKPTSMLQGYDEAIVGTFQLSAEELTELLNEGKATSSSVRLGTEG